MKEELILTPFAIRAHSQSLLVRVSSMLRAEFWHNYFYSVSRSLLVIAGFCEQTDWLKPKKQQGEAKEENRTYSSKLLTSLC